MQYLPLQAHAHKLLSVMINTSGRTSPGTVLYGMIAPYQWSLSLSYWPSFQFSRQTLDG